MKLLLINSVCGIGSTGRICAGIAEEYEQNGYEVKIAYGRSGEVPDRCRKYAVRIGSKADVYAHVLYTRLMDKHGLASHRATRTFLKWADEFDPDIVWLHNIHGYYINYELLFDWIKSRPKMQVKWTLHDCWAFTGHCAHYMYVKCDRWRGDKRIPENARDAVTGAPGFICEHGAACHDCPQKKAYPSSMLIDNSADNYARKKKAFRGVKNLTIITPSGWLASEIKKSFLSDYPVEVVYNTIDTDIFKPVSGSFRSDHGIKEDDRVILAVANVWDERKGLGDFLKLEEALKKEAGPVFRQVIVGVSENQIREIRTSHPDIICIEHTSDAAELAEIYTAADVFVNPTYEDNYPTVNLEAEACGTPVIAYDTGGCRETIRRPDSRVIPQNVAAMAEAVTDLVGL